MAFVYLINIEGSDLYKIGTTKRDPKKRLKSIQTGSPRTLILSAFHKTDIPYKVEKTLHKQLKHKKYIEDEFKDLSGEWFELSQKEVFDFNRRCESIEQNISFLQKSSTLFLSSKKLF